MVAFKCFKIGGGLGVLVDLSGANIGTLTSDDVSIYIADYGLMIKVGDIKIPIPESLIDYILQNRIFVIYPMSTTNYVEDVAFSLEIPHESMIEARGIYFFNKKANRQKENRQEESAITV